MSVMFILIGCSLLLAIGFLAAFIWSVKSGQMDDDYTPSVRILFDDFEIKTPMKEVGSPQSAVRSSSNDLVQKTETNT
jgi:cbb3-type cytochrome oxidase maturation protein